jgi:ATP-dependent Lon protease
MVTPIATTNNDNEAQMEAWKHALNTAFSNFASVNNAIPKGMTQNIRNKANFEEALDTVSSYLDIPAFKRQVILEEADIQLRAEMVLARITELMDNIQIEEKIQQRVKKQMDKNQREYFLNEQIKAIQKELGNSDEQNDIEQLAARIAAAGLSKEAREKAEAELKKLKMMVMVMPNQINKRKNLLIHV